MWKEYETLLGLCDFIIANRPGIRSEALRLVIRPGLIARPMQERIRKRESFAGRRAPAAHHRLSTRKRSNEISATDIRRRAHRGQAIHGLVSARVEESFLNRAYTVKLESLPQGAPPVEAAKEKKSRRDYRTRLERRFRFHGILRHLHRLQHSTGAGICTEIEEQLYKHLGRSPEHREGQRSAEWPCSTSAASSCTFSASRPAAIISRAALAFGAQTGNPR